MTGIDNPAGKVTITSSTVTPPPSLTLTVKKNKWMDEFKRGFWASLILIAVGFSLGRTYAYDSVITDCRVLGMFRIGSTPIGCRVGEKA